jgi:hypothetical protein
LRKFLPVPPKTSLPITTPKLMPERDLPQRDRRRQDQGVEQRGDEETLVDFVVAHDREHDFPEAPGHQRDDVDRQEIQEAMPEAGGDAVRVVADAHARQHGAAPALGRGHAQLGHGEIRLQADVVHAEQRARQHRNHDIGHDALQVDGIAHVRRAARHVARGVQEGVDQLVERAVLLEAPAASEHRLDTVQELAQLAHQPSFSICSRRSRSTGP